MATTLENETRKRRVRDNPNTWNGIDYLEVLDQDLGDPDHPDRQRLLRIFLLTGHRTDTLGVENFRIEGGERIQDINVTDLQILPSESPGDVDPDYVLLRTDRAGDFSMYTLRLVRDPHSAEPPEGFDPRLATVDFTFKAECPTDFDCKPEPEPSVPPPPSPPIDYLTRDFNGFRRLIQDRLSTLNPEWQERGAADVGVAITELLAHAADLQSYHLDAVTTEAYLGTARKRVSIRRHARLLDYSMHDGCNSRVFVALQIAAGAEGSVLQRGSALLTAVENFQAVIDPLQVGAAKLAGAMAFETKHDLTLYAARNELPFYTWGESRATLPAGTTEAVLRIPPGALMPEEGLFRRGDVVILMEKRHSRSGLEAEANPEYRHAVRLIADPAYGRDALYKSAEYPDGVDFLRIEWHREDALPFALDIGEVEDAGPLSVALGNVALADFGSTVVDEELNPPEVPFRGRYRPRLRQNNVTSLVPYKHETAIQMPAGRALEQDPREAEPAVQLTAENEEWRARRDLLNSDRFATEFVVELEEDGRARLRFGDNLRGKRPAALARPLVRYRVGNGRRGNIGAGSIGHLVSDTFASTNLLDISNPMPAAGGVDPESPEQVRLYAPEAFKNQERAVTEEDYARLAERHPDVQTARARLRWTGTWHTVFISVDRQGGRAVDAVFKNEMYAFLDPFRLTGHDLEIKDPLFVPLDIQLMITVEPGYLWSTIKASLEDVFSSGEKRAGGRGFFHPDNYTFGQPVYLSRVITLAMQTTGVERVEVKRFRRFGQDRDYTDAGQLSADRLEILRLDNDPNAPENGRIEFVAGGENDVDRLS